MFNAFLAIFVAVCLLLWALAEGHARWKRRRANRWRIQHRPSTHCERAGSVEFFYRLMRAKRL